MGFVKSLFQTNANLDTAGIYTETITFRVPLEVLQAMPAVCQSLGWALGILTGETRFLLVHHQRIHHESSLL